jgi:hypothetical protein
VSMMVSGIYIDTHTYIQIHVSRGYQM